MTYFHDTYILPSALQRLSNGVCLCGTVTNQIPVSALPLTVTIQKCECNYTENLVTNALGQYCFKAPKGATVTVTPVLGVGVVADPPSRTINQACTDQCDLDFTLSPVVVPVTVSGTVSGAEITNPGITLAYYLNGVESGTALADALGNYSFTALSGSDAVIVPQAIVGQTVAPPVIILTNLAANSSNNNFVYTPIVE